MDFQKYINSRKKENNMQATHDLSSAVRVKEGYMGAKVKEQKSFWQKLKEDIAFKYNNTKAVITGQKSMLQGLKDDIKHTHGSMMEGNQGYRDVVSTAQGVNDALKAKINRKVSENEVLSRLRDNIRSGIQEAKEQNDMNHKYDMSSAVKTSVRGKNAYIGVQKKPSFYQRLKNILTGKKSVYSAVRDNVKDVRAADANVRGTVKGIARTLQELRIAKPQAISSVRDGMEMPIPSKARIQEMKEAKTLSSPQAQNNTAPVKTISMENNKYSFLDNGQFRVALGVAYENLYRLNGHDNPASYTRDKIEVLAEISQVLAEAQKRFPNVGVLPQKGSFYKDSDVANMEQKMMPFMKEAAKQDNVFAQDVKRFKSWRDGKNAVITLPNGKSLVEEPFENKARWPHSMSSSDQLKSPFKAGQNTMSEVMLKQQRNLVAQLKMR